MPKSNLFSIIIPAYNEERRIEKTLKSFYTSFPPQNTEFIIVCDGTKDRTEEIVKKFIKAHKNVHLLSFPNRLGKGGGILKGIKACRGKVIGYVDADSATSPADYKKIYQILISKNLDGAIASRYLPGSKVLVKQPFYRKFLSRGWNFLVRLLFQIPYTDTQCGAKIFTRKALLSVSPKMGSTGFEFDVELLWRLKKSGFKVSEVPTTWAHIEESKFKVSDIIGMFLRLLKVRFAK